MSYIESIIKEALHDFLIKKMSNYGLVIDFDEGKSRKRALKEIDEVRKILDNFKEIVKIKEGELSENEKIEDQMAACKAHESKKRNEEFLRFIRQQAGIRQGLIRGIELDKRFNEDFLELNAFIGLPIEGIERMIQIYEDMSNAKDKFNILNVVLPLV